MLIKINPIKILKFNKKINRQKINIIIILNNSNNFNKKLQFKKNKQIIKNKISLKQYNQNQIVYLPKHVKYYFYI